MVYNKKFIKTEDEFITGITKEETITNHLFTYENEFFQVLVTLEKDYYNIYVINSNFVQEPINCLQLQEPKKIILDSSEYFNEKYCELRAIEFYLWFKYGNSSKDVVYSYSIQENQ